MPRVAMVSLRDYAGELLSEIGRVLLTARPPAFVRGGGQPLEPADPIERQQADDLALEAFLDWDQIRGDGWGFFSSDPHECASRRVDLRGPTDLDPGPLPMEEGPAEGGPLDERLIGEWRVAHYRFFPPN